MAKELNLNDVLLIGGIALGGYALYRFFNKADSAVSGVGSGVSTVAQSAGSMAETTADTYSDLSSLSNPIKALSDRVTDFINKFGKDSTTTKAPDYSTYTNTGSAVIKTNLFTNPTGQSIQPNDMSVWVPPLTVQNTVSLAKSSTTAKNIVGKTVPKTQSIAYKKGYIK